MSNVHVRMYTMNRRRCAQLEAAVEAAQGSTHTLMRSVSLRMAAVVYQQKGIDLIRMKPHILPPHLSYYHITNMRLVFYVWNN